MKELGADGDHWDLRMNLKNMPEVEWSLDDAARSFAGAGDLQYSPLLLLKGRLALASVGRGMVGSSKLSRQFGFGGATLVTRLTLTAILMPFTSAIAAAAMILQVEVSSGLPGFHRGELQRYLASHMAQVGLGEWRFEPAPDSGSAANRVEWTFRLNPYAGGGVRNFAHTSVHPQGFGARRPITIEARLYLNGEYQTLVERQAVIKGGPNDSEFAAAIATTTQNLLGPSGAYHAIDLGLRRGHL